MVYVLQSCNAWKEYSSASILGVFDSEELLAQEVVELFKNGEIDWDGVSFSQIEELAKEEFEDYYENPEGYSDDFSIEEELSEAIDKIEKDICDEILSSKPSDIHNRATYIMVEQFRLNEV